jgi:hypothetical protein
LSTFKLHIEFYYVSNLELLFQKESLAKWKTYGWKYEWLVSNV